MANQAKTPAYRLALLHQMTYKQIAAACDVRADYCSAVFAGRKLVTEKFADKMRDAFGPISDKILALATERYRDLEHERNARPEQRRNARPPIVEIIIDRIEIDYATYQIDEWIAKFGRPGGSHDIHGRANGTFATEPDYCELAAGDSPR
jgi:plasmid maintenance system antidote protein VapI